MKANKLFYFLLVAFLIFNFSCSDYLDNVPSDILTLEKSFETQASTLSQLATVYSYLPDETNQRYVGSGNAQGTSGPWTAASDEAEYVWGFVGSQDINNGAINKSTGFVYELWKKWYNGIHDATIFIQNAHLCNELTSDRLNQWVAEARAVRAIYYYYLLRTYGPVPLLGDEIISLNASTSEVQIPRSSIEDVTTFIVSELDKSIQNGLLPNIKTSSQTNSPAVGFGHIDQAIAQAYKVQVLMLAASPLFNGSNEFFSNLTNNDGKKLFPTFSEDKKILNWEKAAIEAKRFIDLYVGNGYDLNRIYTNGVLNPYLSYREAMRGSKTSTTNNSEIIFYRLASYIIALQYDRTPYHNGAPNSGYRASGALGATQEMVDAYFMSNGLSPILGYQSDGKTPIINSASGYREGALTTEEYRDMRTGQLYAPAGIPEQWVNREPRFYADITFWGQIWLNKSDGEMRTYTNFTGNSGREVGKNDYSPTGYIVRKNAPLGSWTEESSSCVLLRLAQIYLDYVEALNESNPNDPDILKYLNLIRERAGIPTYGSGTNQIAVPLTQEDMRNVIRKERRVELAFENSRYFDIRRWCIAEQVDNKPIHGLNINTDPPTFFQRNITENRIFLPKMYFFPIPEREVDIDKALVQNPGW